MKGGYFITGTGTGVGKTFTTCALIHAARTRNIQVTARKPVLTGAGEKTNDTSLIRDALGVAGTADITRYSFGAPLSPHRAAALEGKSIPFEELVAWSKAGDGLRLVEGVGGAMVPLNDTHTTRDLALALGFPVILVTGSYLGSISHTLSAIEVLKGARIVALVVNETPGSSVTLAETMAGLAPFTRAIGLQVAQPLVSSPANATAIHAMIETLA